MFGNKKKLNAHYKQCNAVHDIAWNEAEVLDSNPRLIQRCALESWHIRTAPPYEQSVRSVSYLTCITY